MGFNWTFDAPAGVYKNHDLSEKLRSASIAETKMMQFVTNEPGYGKKQGESVTITRVSNVALPGNARLNENQVIPQDDLVITTTAVTVVEWGRSVPYTNLSQQLSKFDPENIIQRELRKQMRLSLDNGAADAFTSSDVKVKAIPTSLSAITFDTDGVASTQASVNLNVAHIEAIRDFLFTTVHAPGFIGDDFVGLLSTKAKRGIVNDPAWEQWKKYTDPAAKFNGEIGRVEGIRFVEINNTGALSGSLGAAGVLGEAVIFGEDAVTMAIAEDPELRMEIPKDFGREKAVAWYGILEFGEIWDTANDGEARIVHVTSS